MKPKDNMKMIFSTILDWKLQADGYPGEVTGLSKKIVAGTLEIYKAAVESLLLGHFFGRFRCSYEVFECPESL